MAGIYIFPLNIDTHAKPMIRCLTALRKKYYVYYMITATTWIFTFLLPKHNMFISHKNLHFCSDHFCRNYQHKYNSVV